MLFAQQVVHCFHRVESTQWHLHKNGRPVGHGAVPESRQLLRFQGFGTLRLMCDETRFGVTVFQQVERLVLVVAQSADQVHWVEMCGRLQYGLL